MDMFGGLGGFGDEADEAFQHPVGPDGKPLYKSTKAALQADEKSDAPTRQNDSTDDKMVIDSETLEIQKALLASFDK
jgi:hypothetical protein